MLKSFAQVNEKPNTEAQANEVLVNVVGKVCYLSLLLVYGLVCGWLGRLRWCTAEQICSSA